MWDFKGGGDQNVELERWGEATLRRALRDMLVIREFESMLNSFKSTGSLLRGRMAAKRYIFLPSKLHKANFNRY